MFKSRLSLAVVALCFGLLTGCSSDTGPALVASTVLVDFGEAALGDSTSATVQIDNEGSATAELGLPTFSGQNAFAFALDDAQWPISLEPGASAAVSLRFTPLAAGVASAVLEISAGSGGLSGGVAAAAPGNLSVSVALLGQGIGAGSGDDDDSAALGDDDDTTPSDDDDSAALGDDDDDTTSGADEDGDGHAAAADGGSDCDDTDPMVNPTSYEICDGIDNNCNDSIDDNPIDGTIWHLDSDSDGYGGQLLTQEACSAPSSYVGNSDDCDDLESGIYPGATELCNGIDDDCDGAIDDAAPAAQIWYLDNDGDGVGGFWLTQEACDMPPGYAPDSSDCDDTNAAVYPLAPELCDGSDNDCDGALGGDEIDDDGDGVSECSGDCADTEPLRFPGSLELCDGVDNDCDASTEASGGEVDLDGDLVLSCLDCDDDPTTGSAVYPGAIEVCDDLDNDCDGSADVGASDESTWYFDADGDSYGGFLLTQEACTAPTGYVASSNDCAELDPNSYPGAAELCDGVDNDCNGQIDDGTGATGTTWYADSDADGYGDLGTTSTACSQPTGYVNNSADCDDGNAATNPTSYEICDGLDNNCDGGIDEAGALNATNWYVDSDGDGFGVAGTPLSSCTEPAGYTDNAADCNDDAGNGGAAIHPAASEICNSTDDDCDGSVDDGAIDATIWYVDADGDGYGNLATGSLSCIQLGGTVQDASDCNDTELTVNPVATDVCDGIDNDCDNATDEADAALGTGQNCPATDCEDIVDSHASPPADGDYWINGGGGLAFEARCEMSTLTGGWTLVMHVEPDDGNIVNYVNTQFWKDNAAYGALNVAYTTDFKSEAAYLITATNIMVQVANPGATGSVIGWKAWSMGARTYDSFFDSATNTIQTNTILGEDTGSVNPHEPLLKHGTQLRSNMRVNANGDYSRLAANSYSPHTDDNQPGLGTQMNGDCCDTSYRQMDVELWVNAGTNVWCIAPTTSTYAWLGNDGVCGSSCGSCQSTAGPGFSPYWTYRIWVR